MDNLDRASITADIREIILGVKPLEDGFTVLPDDAPLFDDGGADPSPVNLDSLDTLDVITSIADHFGLEDDRLDSFLKGETDIESFRTINDIAEFIMTAGAGAPAQEPVTAD